MTYQPTFNKHLSHELTTMSTTISYFMHIYEMIEFICARHEGGRGCAKKKLDHFSEQHGTMVLPKSSYFYSIGH